MSKIINDAIKELEEYHGDHTTHNQCRIIFFEVSQLEQKNAELKEGIKEAIKFAKAFEKWAGRFYTEYEGNYEHDIMLFDDWLKKWSKE